MSDNYENNSEVLDRDEIDIEEPKDHVCLVINDDFTTVDFVEEIMMTVFHKSVEDAKMLTRDVHEKGRAEGFRGIYDICMTKKQIVEESAKNNGFPLRVEVAEV